MVRKVLKYMFIFLTFVVLVTVIVSQGCTSASTSPASTPSSTVQSQQSSRQGQQPSQQNGGRQPGGQGGQAYMNSVLAKVADKLGVSVDSVTQAYQQAQSQVTPPTPPSGASGNPPTPPTAGSHNGSWGSDNRSASMNSYTSAIIQNMSVTLNIPADKITAAWQAAMTELRPSRSGNPPTGSSSNPQQ